MVVDDKGDIQPMTQPTLIVQASSRSWSGGPDLCLNPVEGTPAVAHTISRILEAFPQSHLIVAAPDFDRGGALDALVAQWPAERVQMHYGQDDSPLNRMLVATSGLSDTDYLVRVDGVHFCFDPTCAQEMLRQAQFGEHDAVKLPDDFPVQFGSDIYRVGALRQLDGLLTTEEQRVFRVHPKFYFFAHPQQFRCAYADTLPQYDDAYLWQCRERAKTIYAVPRLEVNAQRLWVGDQLSFHYEMAGHYLQPTMKVLDIACGDGYGARRLSTIVAEVHGGDIDADNVEHARSMTKEPNVFFHMEDVTSTSFASNSFDAVLSLETIEHVDDDSCLRELHRILRPGGTLILSTPQNRLGHIPINTAHRQEYSLEQITALCARHFNIREIIGIKAGRVVIPSDPIGANVMLICEKLNY
jgi:2-polyprenyl-3-methyl-5-hydroxy-6-metoxy-1,4-benzoquinol methylase/spore coat polysaccharide biosynthesis protein SpsF (cytidylyltransferase family)